ncbi:MAG: hypothetical protein HYS12_03780 [Planctomycetes bacterium]|nr:hypothetical protein [Planctomycetota bacterium]
MAEPQEVSSPPGAQHLTSRLPDAPTPQLGDAPEQDYRSLSVLALVGFGMSALYAAISLLLGLVALLSRKPMPELGWTLLIPVAGFLLCVMPPPQRTGLREEDPDLRRKLEERVAAAMASSGGTGQFTHFLRQDVIRAILAGGLETTFVPNGVKSCDDKPGGYRVVLSYRITTPDCWFDAQIAVESTDGEGRGEGPQWNIDMSGMKLDGPMRYTESGKAMMELIRSSRGFVDTWQKAMQEPSSIEIHLLTLPEGHQRDSARALLRQRPALGTVAGGAASARGRPEIVAAFQRTCRGDCVQADVDAVIDEAARKQVLEALRSYFAPGPKEQRQLKFSPETSHHPTRQRLGDVIRLGFDTTFEDQDHLFRADIILVLEADAAALRRALPPVSPHWRFAAMKLAGAEIAPPGRRGR